jgi:hypothetical protein
MENWENSKAFMKRLIDRSCTIHKIFQRGKSLAEARNNTKEMKSSLQLTSCICATRFSMSQVNEFKKLISSLHVCIATYTELHQTNATFELKTWEMCGQDFKPSELSPCHTLFCRGAILRNIFYLDLCCFAYTVSYRQ